MTKNNIELVPFNREIKFEKNNTVLHSNRYLSYKYYEEVMRLRNYFLKKLDKSKRGCNSKSFKLQ